MKKIISKLSTAIALSLSKGQLLALSVIEGLTVFLLLTPPVLAQANLGTIQPPPGIPGTSANPTGFVADLIKKGLSLLIIVSFVAAFVWLILGGLKFITSGGDPKAVEGARSQITWGIIGLVVILCAYAIIRVVETFFNIAIISGTFSIPQLI